MDLVRLQDVCKTYRRGEIQIPVLRGVSMQVQRGELVALVGVSGSGKTTLMNILGCLDRPTSGQYWLNGVEVGGLAADHRAALRNLDVGFVFQNFSLLPRTSALGNVMLPLTYAPHHVSGKEARQRAARALELVGLSDRMDHEPSQLSGGQQQRVAIARALINQPKLVFADEPTGNLDSRTTEDVLRLFQRLNADQGITVVLVTHDPSVAGHTRRVIRMVDGQIVDEGPPQAVLRGLPAAPPPGQG
jgi:ABC-type lipoprotein export system ATPase subunit